MIQKVFGVRDGKAQAFLQPFFSVAVGSAVRAFSDTVNEGNNQIAKHPEDYVLFELGSWFDDSGRYDVYAAPVSVGIAIEFKRS